MFGAYGHRILRKVRLAGEFFDSKGALRQIELSGPPTFECWLASWAVYRNALLILKAVELGTLLDYQKLQERHQDMHGASAWPLLCQFDFCSRLEHMERVRRAAFIA